MVLIKIDHSPTLMPKISHDKHRLTDLWLDRPLPDKFAGSIETTIDSVFEGKSKKETSVFQSKSQPPPSLSPGPGQDEKVRPSAGVHRSVGP